MDVNLEVSSSEEYFLRTAREIDWEEDGDANKIPHTQADRIHEILAAEVSIFLMRRTAGCFGSLIDSMVSVRRRLIVKYEEDYEEYVEYNDFY